VVLFLRLAQVNYQQKQQDKEQPVDYVMASGDLVSSPLAAVLDPRVDLVTAQQQLMTEPTEPPSEPGQGLQQEMQFENEPLAVADDAANIAKMPTTATTTDEKEPTISS
jgi:anaerobic glycerol-3-phosphate dehydrogenase